MINMNRKIILCPLFLIFLSLISAQDISRIQLMGFHYFPMPVPLTPARLIDGDGAGLIIDGSSRSVLLIAFLGGEDPFSPEMREGLLNLEKRFAGRPFHVIIVSENRDDYKDREGRAAGKWGVMNYPTFLLADHNLLLRASAEGIYPDFGGEDFYKVIEELLLDIQAPGIINTLK